MASASVSASATVSATVSAIAIATTYFAPSRTIVADSKKEWLCANVPCIVISKTDASITVKPFNKKGELKVSNDIFDSVFQPLESDDEFVYSKSYPHGRIWIQEFNIKPISILPILKYFNQIQNQNHSQNQYKNLLTLLEKAEHDSYTGKGNTACINMSKYNDYIAKTKTINILERIGDPVFNRTSRHTTPIPVNFNRQQFEASPSFPAPIGIRNEDFAWPSEQNEILRQLLSQIFSCKNAPECPEEIREKIGFSIIPNSHKCEWCGQHLDIHELNQEYCSEVHSVNFCHRDPNLGTRPNNVYIGHCSCNREQGGYSEEERISQTIRIASHNPKYKEMLLQALNPSQSNPIQSNLIQSIDN